MRKNYPISLKKLVLTAFLSFSSQPILAGQIETYSSWDGSNGYMPWGTDGTQTYGEILTPDSNISLTDFSYYLKKTFRKSNLFSSICICLGRQ
jgi:hypothetical protein